MTDNFSCEISIITATNGDKFANEMTLSDIKLINLSNIIIVYIRIDFLAFFFIYTSFS